MADAQGMTTLCTLRFPSLDIGNFGAHKDQAIVAISLIQGVCRCCKFIKNNTKSYTK